MLIRRALISPHAILQLIYVSLDILPHFGCFFEHLLIVLFYLSQSGELLDQIFILCCRFSQVFISLHQSLVCFIVYL